MASRRERDESGAETGPLAGSRDDESGGGGAEARPILRASTAPAPGDGGVGMALDEIGGSRCACETTGIGAELGWKSMSVYHGERSEPLVRLDEKATALLAQVGATHVILSLSHTETAAMAVAAIVRA